MLERYGDVFDNAAFLFRRLLNLVPQRHLVLIIVTPQADKTATSQPWLWLHAKRGFASVHNAGIHVIALIGHLITKAGWNIRLEYIIVIKGHCCKEGSRYAYEVCGDPCGSYLWGA